MANTYEVAVSELQAKQMRSDVTATVYRGDVETSNTLLYTIETYAAGKYNGGTSNLEVLLKMMMHYGDSAAKYFS